VSSAVAAEEDEKMVISMTRSETAAYDAGRSEWAAVRSDLLSRAEAMAHDEDCSVTIETADGIVYTVIERPYSDGPCLRGAYAHGEDE